MSWPQPICRTQDPETLRRNTRALRAIESFIHFNRLPSEIKLIIIDMAVDEARSGLRCIYIHLRKRPRLPRISLIRVSREIRSLAFKALEATDPLTAMDIEQPSCKSTAGAKHNPVELPWMSRRDCLVVDLDDKSRLRPDDRHRIAPQALQDITHVAIKGLRHIIDLNRDEFLAVFGFDLLALPSLREITLYHIFIVPEFKLCCQKERWECLPIDPCLDYGEMTPIWKPLLMKTSWPDGHRIRVFLRYYKVISSDRMASEAEAWFNDNAGALRNGNKPKFSVRVTWYSFYPPLPGS
ncbi:hypothetical protein VP1G_11011 [Cytospora mali]|uniref:Uncharacterized protein n=1 Tax=Cytospora mali TaxID=578113 RepID=A0A194V2E7_CYTMA|nr:hypothetical protein VP1G_11011 [Valsa mali var. pyri (nom. inval.)]